jgi:cytochrome c6
MYSLEAIMTQVKNGKNVMPAFGKKLKPVDIENVATYVLAQADSGWKKK